MGDLIQRLPMDDIFLPKDERANFQLLFGDEDHSQEQRGTDGNDSDQRQSARDRQEPTALHKKEFISIIAFFVIFFLMNTPWVQQMIQCYIPLCSKSWIATNCVQSLIAAFVLYFILNLNYCRNV